MSPYAVAGFLAAVLPLVATPGASLTLLVQRVTTGGRRECVPVVLGTVTGLYVHATLAGLGLSALVMRSSQVFALVRLCGAGYLLLLGIALWRSAGTRAGAEAGAEAGTEAVASGRRFPRGRRPTYVQALLGNVLNPKAASIYLTLAPQFVDAHRQLLPQLLILATAQAALMTVWLLAWTLALARAARTAASARIRARLTRVAAAAMVGLALRSATGPL